jgi:ribokinase
VPRKLDAAIPALRNTQGSSSMPRVVVFGSSNTDMTVRVQRLPVPGQTVLGDGFSTTPGGKGANQAVAARRAGADVAFVTAVGDDDLGKRALELYQNERIDVSHIRILSGVASGVALIFVAADGENMIGVASGANFRLTPDDVDRLPSSLFRTGDVLLASLEIPVETSTRALRRGIKAGMRTILNPAPAPTLSPSQAQELLSIATVVTPNRVEALALAGWTPEPGVEPDWAACGSCLSEMGSAAVVITLGSRGCHVVAGKPRLIPAPEVEAVDTVGAGDAFNGALAVALAEGRPLEEAAQWANAAAALAVTRPGAQAALAFRDSIDQLARRITKTN